MRAQEFISENFADGKKPGRKGLAKRVGVPTKASVSKLRSIAAHSSGEKQRMAHWMANMKAGKQKKNESEMDEGWKQNVAAGVLGAGMALGSGAAQADTDVFNKKFTPAEIQQLQTKADLTQRYYNELVRRAKEDGRIMDRTTLNMLKAQAEDAAARSVQQRPQAPQAKSALPGTQPSEIRRSKNYDNFEEGVRKSPSQYGGGAPAMSAQRMTAPPISTVDRSAPWTKAAIGKAYKRTTDFNELKTAKEKFDFLYNLTAGKTAHKIRIDGPRGIRGYSNNLYHIQSYNPSTGDITLTLKTRESDNTVTGNVNDFTYKGRMGTATGSKKTYTFIPGKLTMVGSEPKTATNTLGRPGPKKYNFPKMPW